MPPDPRPSTLDTRPYLTGVTNRIPHGFSAGIARGTLREMDDAEVTAQAHFLLGARHFVEEMLARGGIADEAVVDAYLALVGDGLRRRKERR